MAKFFITTPIYYVNDVPHIGSAYTTLAADVLARAHRQNGNKVRFITGTDEHGSKIARKAEEQGVSPQEYADTIAGEFRKTWDGLEISYDEFVRTTDEKHKYLAGQVIQLLYDKEYIYPGAYEGWYCVNCEEYKDIRPGGGTNKDPLCEIHGKPLEFIKEQIYYFSLSKFQDQLIDIIEKNKIKIEPETRKNEALAFLQGEPLRDIPVTRSKVSWGIPVPFAPDQTIYVWFEALLNYLTYGGVKIDSGANNDSQTLSVSKKKTNGSAMNPSIENGSWPAELQLLGKDILRFHAVIWPAILLALHLPLPKKLFVHGFFTIDGEKMSKTKGNVISPQELIDRYGVDATRFLILSAFPFGADGDISLEKLDEAYTAHLANGIGNLLQRTIVLVNKYGIKPQTEAPGESKVRKAYLSDKLTEAIQLTLKLVADANGYVAVTEPWAIDNDVRRETVLVKLYEKLETIADALVPLMPQTAYKIKNQLQTLTPEPLFPRLDR